jgi:cytoskeleton protein RodZ
LSELEILGAQFRRAREDRQLTFDQIERQTRIRAHYLEAIELGNFGIVPSPVQLRGFVRNYARAVGLDPDLMLAQVEDALANPRSRKPKKQRQTETLSENGGSHTSSKGSEVIEAYRAPVIVPRASHSNIEVAAQPAYPSRKRGPLRTAFVVIVATILTGAIVGGLLVAIEDLTQGEPTPSPEALREAEIVDSFPTIPTATPTLNLLPPPDQPIFEGGVGELFIVIIAEQRSWLRVVADGNVVFEGVVAPPDLLQYPANQSLTLRTSNAGGLRVTINNQEFRLGEGRQAFEQTFTLDGLVTPTFAPTLTPSITFTPSVTFTLGASITPTLTNTATTETDSTAGLTSPASPSQSISGVISPTPLPPIGVELSPTPTPTNEPLATAANPTVASPTPLTFNSPTATPSRTPTNTVPPSNTPNITMTPSPFLPERATRTPTIQK